MANILFKQVCLTKNNFNYSSSYNNISSYSLYDILQSDFKFSKISINSAGSSKKS